MKGEFLISSYHCQNFMILYTYQVQNQLKWLSAFINNQYAQIVTKHAPQPDVLKTLIHGILFSLILFELQSIYDLSFQVFFPVTSTPNSSSFIPMQQTELLLYDKVNHHQEIATSVCHSSANSRRQLSWRILIWSIEFLLETSKCKLPSIWNC